jgi:uncharacterized protein (TIGR04255 family)
MPSFTDPPVQEVALGVGFRPLAGLHAVQLGPLWQQWRERYPHVEEQPPLPASGDVRAGFAVSVGPPPMNRHWFLSADGDRLVQMQADRLVVNWRQTTGQDYPRYDALRAELVQRLDDVQRFSNDGGWGPLSPTDIEVTYVNLVRGSDGQRPALEELLDGLTDPEMPGTVVETQLARHYRWPGAPQTDLTLTAGPGAEAAALVITLVARGSAVEPEVAALDALDAAHERLVRTFTAVTRASMHQAWGRTS